MKFINAEIQNYIAIYWTTCQFKQLNINAVDQLCTICLLFI